MSRCGPEPGTPDLIGEGLVDRPNTMRFQNVLLVVLIASVTTLASAIDGKCSACVAVASSLQAALELERPRVHVDMRGRLDSKGKRYGKLIEYKVSELRFVELLEGLCDAVGEKYGLQGGIWRTGKSDGKLAQRKALRKELEGYCHRIVEEQEDLLQSALYGGTLVNEEVETLMCRVYSPKDCDGVAKDRDDETSETSSDEKKDL